MCVQLVPGDCTSYVLHGSIYMWCTAIAVCKYVDASHAQVKVCMCDVMCVFSVSIWSISVLVKTVVCTLHKRDTAKDR